MIAIAEILEGGDIMKKTKYYLKQLFPLTYWSKYKTPDGKTYVAIWSQWFGKVFNNCNFEVNN